MNRSPLTVFEYDTVGVDDHGGDRTLTSREADQASRICTQRPAFCSRAYRSMRFSHYSGVVNLGGRLVEVLPKIEERGAKADDCRGVFLRLLGLAEGVRLTRLGGAEQATRTSPLLDVFIDAFFDEVGAVLRGGLLQRYRARQDDLPLIRGRLLLHQQLGRYGLRMDRLACEFDELTADNDWNRVLKAGLSAIKPRLRSARLKRRWSELWAAFDDVTEKSRNDRRWSLPASDRQAARYADAVRWAEWILALESPSLRAGDDSAPGLLFDSNMLFERAIARHLGRRCGRHPSRPTVIAQDTGRHLAQVGAGDGKPAVPVRPDLMLCLDGAAILLADTKWKRVDVDRHGFLVPATQDVHQLLAYATAFGCEDVALIYPWHRDLGKALDTTLRITAFGASVQLHIVVLDVGCEELPIRLGAGAPWLGELFS